MFPSPFYNPFGDARENSNFAREAKAISTAQFRYLDIKRKSWWIQKLNRLIGRPNRLKELSQVRQHNNFINYHPLGIQSVIIDCIIGSENRADDFDARFLPIKNHNAERWIKIAELMLLHVNLPAVDLIKVNDHYFVRDGHHRISVAKNFGQKHIDANVIELVLAPLEAEPQAMDAEGVLAMNAQACPT
jgi:hypothetical protein